MANVQEPTKPNAPTGTSTPNQQEHRRADEERNRQQGVGTQQRESTATTATHGRENAQEVGQQMRDQAQALGTQVREQVQELGTQAQQLGTQVKETASQYYEQGREGLQELNQTLETQIREKPLQSLLIAGGVGLLLGLLWRRS
jgi:ElaB/YqjD/DUF883 family membrane-anchored ribosome-binding protein